VPPDDGNPPNYDSDNPFGWNAGARSYTELNGDLLLQYDVPRPIGGAICGIAPVVGYVVAQPSSVAHGIFVFSIMGAAFWRTWEHEQISTPEAWGGSAADAVLNVRIVRASSGVYYRVTDGTTVWNGEFESASSGMQLTLGCLYASGDQIV